MNNLDKITDRILDDARREAAGITDSADGTAADILEQARQRGEDIVSSSAVRDEKEAQAYLSRAASSADMKRREILLSTKVGLINRVYERAEQYLYELSDEDMCVFLAHLLADAAVEISRETERLEEMYNEGADRDDQLRAVFSPADREKLGALVIKAAKAFIKRCGPNIKINLSLSDETADIKGGFILRCGDIDTNCSISAVIEEVRKSTESRVAEILFADGGAKPADKETRAD